MLLSNLLLSPVQSQCTIELCVFSDNKALIGAAIYVGERSNISVLESKFTKNQAEMQGSVFYVHKTQNTLLSLEQSRIYENTCSQSKCKPLESDYIRQISQDYTFQILLPTTYTISNILFFMLIFIGSVQFMSRFCCHKVKYSSEKKTMTIGVIDRLKITISEETPNINIKTTTSYQNQMRQTLIEDTATEEALSDYQNASVQPSIPTQSNISTPTQSNLNISTQPNINISTQSNMMDNQYTCESLMDHDTGQHRSTQLHSEITSQKQLYTRNASAQITDIPTTAVRKVWGVFFNICLNFTNTVPSPEEKKKYGNVWQDVIGSKLLVFVLEISGVFYPAGVRTKWIIFHRFTFLIFWISAMCTSIITFMRDPPGYQDGFDTIQYFIQSCESVFYNTSPILVHFALCIAVKIYYPMLKEYFEREASHLHKLKGAHHTVVKYRMRIYCILYAVTSLATIVGKIIYDSIVVLPTHMHELTQFTSVMFYMNTTFVTILSFHVIYLMLLVQLIFTDMMISLIISFFRKLVRSISSHQFCYEQSLTQYLAMRYKLIWYNYYSLIVILAYVIVTILLGGVVLMKFVWQSYPQALVFFYVGVLIFLLLLKSCVSGIAGDWYLMYYIEEEILRHNSKILNLEHHEQDKPEYQKLKKDVRHLGRLHLYMKQNVFVFFVLGVEITVGNVIKYLTFIATGFTAAKFITSTLESVLYMRGVA